VTVHDINDNQTHPPDSAEATASEPPAPVDATAVAPRKTHAILVQVIPAAIAVVAWFVPGLGHLVMRRWQRALAFFLGVGGLAVSGYLMRGNVFPPHSRDPFGTLGFLADAGSGVFYVFSRAFEAAGPNVSRASGDYGTRFIAAAGILNALGICDAYEIASRRRR
jgi:hypothetical protein